MRNPEDVQPMARQIEVMFGIYGAMSTPEGDFIIGYSFDVKDLLQKILDNTPSQIVNINNSTWGPDDMAHGHEKHFAAIVRYTDDPDEGATYAFACQEGQTIDFSRRKRAQWTDTAQNRPDPPEFKVRHAVYGAIDANNVMQARDVTATFQALVDNTPTGRHPNDYQRQTMRLTITNENMGGDPAVGVVKHFGAHLSRAGRSAGDAGSAFACQEGQTVDLLATRALWPDRLRGGGGS